jgi:hypothetical protein
MGPASASKDFGRRRPGLTPVDIYTDGGCIGNPGPRTSEKRVGGSVESSLP